MKLSKVLATAAAFGMALPVMADTLELRVVGDGDAASVAGGGVINIYIQGRIPGATDDGLALWGANLDGGAFDVTGAVLDSPGGDIDQFKKNLGLTNPAGYGGTAIGGDMIQVGGGQNTIGNAGPTLFPVGTVATDVANGAAWVDLATGTIDMTSQAGDVTLSLNTGFANTLAANTGPVFPVNAATVSIVGSLLVTAGGATPFDFTGVASTGNHNANGSFGGGDLDIPVNAADGAAKTGLIEPRQFGAAGNLSIRVDFGAAVGSGSVSSNPALANLVATPNGSSLDITFDAPANGTCYSFDISGTTDTGTGVTDEGNGTADEDFCVCYQEGDINFDSFVNLGDRGVVALPANLFNTMDAVGITGPQVDLNRDGIMNLGDRGVVALPANLFNDFTAVTCP
jgi:hypothetical protein